MQHQGTLFRNNQLGGQGVSQLTEWLFSRQAVIGIILVVALLAFEAFNFDTTQYALANLLGDVAFLRIPWATILAFAFCAIDFAGLSHLFTPERGRDEPKETWYLMGAWLLGATMNALMTWWAINLTLLNHQFGNEVLTREQLLNTVPVFVAVLVWLTRILFIGAFSVAGDHIFRGAGKAVAKEATVQPVAQPRPQPQPQQPQPQSARRWPVVEVPESDEMPAFLQNPQPELTETRQPAPPFINNRGNRRPSRPSLPGGSASRLPAPMRAAPRRRD